MKILNMLIKFLLTNNNLNSKTIYKLILKVKKQLIFLKILVISKKEKQTVLTIVHMKSKNDKLL